MPDTTFIIHFELRNQADGTQTEEQEHTVQSDAWDAFRLFAEPVSAEMYSRIVLVERNWTTDVERDIAVLEFPAPCTSEIKV